MRKMLKYLGISIAALIGACTRPAERPMSLATPINKTSIYDIKIKDIDGEIRDLSEYKGKKILIVNTASKCGFTPQYKDLQKLHEQFGSKIAVLGFPCNQFGGQEPGSKAEIENFCTKNYGVTFPLFEKSDVKGSNQSPLFSWLTNKDKNGWNEQEPTWNFCKYLINEKGELIAFYPSRMDPMDEVIISQLK